MTTSALDLVIVGAGPCGLAVAIAAKQHGLRFAIVDRGCITNSLVQYPYYMTFFSTAERLEIGGIPFAIPEPKPTRRDALVYYRHVADRHGVTVRQYEEVTEIVGERLPKAGGEGYRIRTVRRRGAHSRGAEKEMVARAVVIATGGFGRPNRLELPDSHGGYPERIIHYYKEPYPFFGQDAVVVGGGNSAVEAALDLHRNGVRVRMVHFADIFDRGVKPWVRPDIENRVAEGAIPMHWKSRVAALGPGTVTIASEDGGSTADYPNDWVFAMTGWRPDGKLLAELGVESDPVTGIPAHDPATMETNIPGVYVAGVIAAGFDANKIFIENGREHGAMIAADIALTA